MPNCSQGIAQTFLPSMPFGPSCDSLRAAPRLLSALPMLWKGRMKTIGLGGAFRVVKTIAFLRNDLWKPLQGRVHYIAPLSLTFMYEWSGGFRVDDIRQVDTCWVEKGRSWSTQAQEYDTPLALIISSENQVKLISAS